MRPVITPDKLAKKIMDIAEAKKYIDEIGFLNIDIEKKDLAAEIKRLKEEKNAIILAHYYQKSSIQDIADFIGDSLELSRKAAKTEADIIVFCGVHFMAETAKILSPSKRVFIPDFKAGCSLSDSCPPDKFKAFVESRPNATVISYINCSAEIKALSDIICTSSNAETIVNSVPRDKEIIFAPDKNLGKFLERKTNRKFILWDGACMVHQEFDMEKTEELLYDHPNAKFIAHPESVTEVLNMADFIGSTSQLLKFVQSDNANEYIVATEDGILHQMRKAAPHKNFIVAACDEYQRTCACGECPYMKLNTIEKLYTCLKYEMPEITIPEDIRLKALRSIDKMMELSASIK